jgi:short-subunit dehydrogenase
MIMAEKVNIVLGGTSGLGGEIVDRLRNDGELAWVLGSSYDEERHGEGFGVDLADGESVDSATEEMKSKLGDQIIKSFYWVSGYGYNGDFSEQEEPRRMAVVNFAGPLPLVQAAWRRVLDQDEGTIAVVSSSTGEKARDNEAVYAGTKFAQVGFTRSLGLEAVRLGTKANVALFKPGGMRTPFWDGNEPEAYDTYNDPKKVADAIVDAVDSQEENYTEQIFERGSLV